MQQKIVSTRDLAFQLYELHEVEKVLRFERYQDHSRETLQAALDEVRNHEQDARRTTDNPDRGIWHALALVFRACYLLLKY